MGWGMFPGKFMAEFGKDCPSKGTERPCFIIYYWLVGVWGTGIFGNI